MKFADGLATDQEGDPCPHWDLLALAAVMGFLTGLLIGALAVTAL